LCLVLQVPVHLMAHAVHSWANRDRLAAGRHSGLGAAFRELGGSRSHNRTATATTTTTTVSSSGIGGTRSVAAGTKRCNLHEALDELDEAKRCWTTSRIHHERGWRVDCRLRFAGRLRSTSTTLTRRLRSSSTSSCPAGAIGGGVGVCLVAAVSIGTVCRAAALMMQHARRGAQ
jgi:hypothetical protein